MHSTHRTVHEAQKRVPRFWHSISSHQWRWIQPSALFTIHKIPTLSGLGLQLLGHLIFKDVEYSWSSISCQKPQIFNSPNHCNLTGISNINDLPENKYQLVNWEIKAYTEDGIFSYFIIKKRWIQKTGSRWAHRDFTSWQNNLRDK